jgi:hypothetical protein
MGIGHLKGILSHSSNPHGYIGRMRLSLPAGCFAFTAFCVTSYASILPTVHLDGATLKAFQDYVANFEKSVSVQFSSSGKLWIDNECCGGKHAAFENGKPVVEPRESADVAGGSIHHFSGAIHVKGGTIEAMSRVMQDYPNYPRYFKPDVGVASGTREPDSTPGDLHYKTRLVLVQTTLWMNVTFDTLYDVHYRRLDKDRWTARSTALSIKEQRDAKNPAEGTYPEGDDHGFLWRTNTYWFARERNGGLDLEADSISLSRPNVTGFAWWGTRRTRDAVDKMLRDVKAAVESVTR